MTGSDGWRPRASMETLRLRADIVASIREFFMQRNVLEVETPSLSTTGCTDPNIEPVTARVQALGKGVHYLATSPEHAMKRLLAAGLGRHLRTAPGLSRRRTGTLPPTRVHAAGVVSGRMG